MRGDVLNECVYILLHKKQTMLGANVSLSTHTVIILDILQIVQLLYSSCIPYCEYE